MVPVSLSLLCLMLTPCLYSMEPDSQAAQPEILPTILLKFVNHDVVRFPRHLAILSEDARLQTTLLLEFPPHLSNITKNTMEGVTQLLNLFVTRNEANTAYIERSSDNVHINDIDDIFKDVSSDQIKAVLDCLSYLKIKNQICMRIKHHIIPITFPNSDKKDEDYPYYLTTLTPFTLITGMLSDLGYTDDNPWDPQVAIPLHNITNKRSFDAAITLLYIIKQDKKASLNPIVYINQSVINQFIPQKISAYFDNMTTLQDIHSLLHTLSFIGAPQILIDITLSEYIKQLKKREPQKNLSLEEPIIDQTFKAIIHAKLIDPIIAHIQNLPGMRKAYTKESICWQAFFRILRDHLNISITILHKLYHIAQADKDYNITILQRILDTMDTMPNNRIKKQLKFCIKIMPLSFQLNINPKVAISTVEHYFNRGQTNQIPQQTTPLQASPLPTTMPQTNNTPLPIAPPLANNTPANNAPAALPPAVETPIAPPQQQTPQPTGFFARGASALKSIFVAPLRAAQWIRRTIASWLGY